MFESRHAGNCTTDFYSYSCSCLLHMVIELPSQPVSTMHLSPSLYSRSISAVFFVSNGSFVGETNSSLPRFKAHVAWWTSSFLNIPSLVRSLLHWVIFSCTILGWSDTVSPLMNAICQHFGGPILGGLSYFFAIIFLPVKGPPFAEPFEGRHSLMFSCDISEQQNI